MRTLAADPRDRRRAYRLLSRIYALLNSNEWTIRFARLGENHRLRDKFGHGANTVGLCDDDEQVLYVDHRRDILATIVHECLHALLPNKKENEVRDLEELIMNGMSPTQAKRLYLIAAQALEKSAPSR